MVRQNLRFISVLAMLLAMTSGCVSHKAYVLARRDPQFSPSPGNRIALVNHLKPRPEEQALCSTLTAEMKQQGFHLVPQEEADYTLTYWIEDNWQLRKVPVRTYDPGVNQASPPLSTLTPGASGLFSNPFDTSYRVIETMVEDPVAVQGIRLQLYSRPGTGTNRLLRVWDGYIDAGFKVSPEREPVLVKTLLRFFGKDYTGRARLFE